MLLGGPGQGHKEKIHPRLTKRKTTCEIGGILRFASLWFQLTKVTTPSTPAHNKKVEKCDSVSRQRHNTGKWPTPRVHPYWEAGSSSSSSHKHIYARSVFIRFSKAGGRAGDLLSALSLAHQMISPAYIESFTQVINNEGRAGMGDPNALILVSCCYLFYSLSRPGLEMHTHKKNRQFLEQVLTLTLCALVELTKLDHN